MMNRASNRLLALITSLVTVSGFAFLAPATATAAEETPTPPASTPLPTVQIDGVAWQQLVVGDTVYVGGSFATARPAGSAPGTNTVVRQNLLAFDINTGALKPEFVANTNAQVLGLTASPDGSRIYVSGEFTSVNGINRYRIAALDPTTGAVIQSFNASTDYRVRSVVATNTTVYVAGAFGSAGGATRTNLAAFRASDGAVLNWAPQVVGGQVMGISMAPAGDRIVVAGAFTSLNGVAAFGLGAVDPASGATVSFPANSLIKNSGSAAAIYSLTADSKYVYGSGYTYGSGGNVEGNFATDAGGGLAWINDIHGDQYDVHSARGMLFTVGHAHADGNVEGGFPQGSPSKNSYALAQTSDPAGTVQPTTTGYANWGGRPSSRPLHWFPDFTPGTYTDSNQAGWSVSGNDRYLVVAGEFTEVNLMNQQGIVRFPFRDQQPSQDAPRLSAAAMVATLRSTASGEVQVSWLANFDRDDADLTYLVQREGVGTIATYTANSSFFTRPVLTHVESGLAPGSVARYRVVTEDPSGLRAFGDYAQITVAATGAPSSYSRTVLSDGPNVYRRMGDAGTALADSAGTWNGSVTSGVVRGVPGAIPNDANTATRFSGSLQTGWNSAAVITPVSLSTEAWVKTTSTRGGVIVGYGDKASTASSKLDYVTYMGSDGRIHFGVEENTKRIVSSAGKYNDGSWHHVVSTLSWAGGQVLYVDGQQVASNPQVKHGRNYSGFWRIGGDNLSGWPNRPTSDYLAADLDEVATYLSALSPTRVAAHYKAGGGLVPNKPPTAAFSTKTDFLNLSVDGTTSTDEDGTISSYAWDFGDGTQGSGAKADHAYGQPGTYTVKLTVTDNDGGTATKTQSVSVVAPPPNQLPTAAFTAGTTFLDLSVDATDATDSDGTISSYAWDFGDGTQDTGVKAAHSYAQPGTYTVSLTVTDDDGGTATSSRVVTVEASPSYVSDAFDRTVASGWGSAVVGGAWSLTGVISNYSVDGSEGLMVLNAAGAKREASLPINRADVDYTTKVSLNKPATGGGIYLSLGARRNGTNSYLGRLRFLADGTIALHVQRLNNGVATTLAGGQVSGLSYSAGDKLKVRVQVTGATNPVVRAKVWAAGSPEPATWMASATDASATPLAAGGVFVEAYMSGSSTNAPLTVRLDDLVVAPAG